MKITRKSGQVITLEQATNYTSLFQEKNPSAIKSYFIGIDHLNELLNQKGCMGMRIYPGINNQTDSINLVLIGVDIEENDIIKGVILEELITCPPLCPDKTNPLNKR